MFCGVFMIMVFDPQIMFNDGFYDLMEVRTPPRLPTETPPSGRALLPHPMRSAASSM